MPLVKLPRVTATSIAAGPVAELVTFPQIVATEGSLVGSFFFKVAMVLLRLISTEMLVVMAA